MNGSVSYDKYVIKCVRRNLLSECTVSKFPEYFLANICSFFKGTNIVHNPDMERHWENKTTNKKIQRKNYHSQKNKKN